MDKNELIEEFSKCRENLERYAVSLTGNIEDAEDLVSDLCIALLERNTDCRGNPVSKGLLQHQPSTYGL